MTASKRSQAKADGAYDKDAVYQAIENHTAALGGRMVRAIVPGDVLPGASGSEGGRRAAKPEAPMWYRRSFAREDLR